MKKHIILACLAVLAVWNNSIAQNKNLRSELLRGDSAISDTLVENKLVELALDGPMYKNADHEIIKNKLQVKKARNSWFDLLNISLNYNDQTFSKESGNNTFVYPKYFFGLTLPIGMFFSKGADIKTARENVKVNENTKEELRRSIKMDVLSKYRQYKSFSSLIVLQSALSDEQQALFLQAEKLFSEGKVSLEGYSNTSKTYVNQLATIINLELQKDLVRLEIESMIGINLETAILQSKIVTSTK